MFDFTNNLRLELAEKLASAETNHNPHALSPDSRLECIGSAISRLIDKLKVHVFETREEEIEFFKFQLPEFLGACIFHTEKWELESIRMAAGPNFREQYLLRRLRQIDDFFSEHAEFYKYMKSGLNHMDQYYFLRPSPEQPEKPEWLVSVMYTSICTPYSMKAARILAYMDLERHLDFLNRNPRPVAEQEVEAKLVWTDSKVAIIELIYSLKEKGSFNNGNADLKTIVEWFETNLDICLGNVSRTFQEIVCRKKGYTLYLDGLKTCLLSRIDDIEERHLR